MAKRRPKAVDGDRLGPVKAEYRADAGGIVGVAVLLFLAAGGLLGSSFFRPPPTSWYLLMGGTFLLLLSPVVLLANVFNVGRSLQVRKHGVRFVQAGIETEMTWDEIAHVDVQETRHTKYGAVPVATEWDITIHGQTGRTIHLSPVFLRHVPDARLLAQMLRHKAGQA